MDRVSRTFPANTYLTAQELQKRVILVNGIWKWQQALKTKQDKNKQKTRCYHANLS